MDHLKVEPVCWANHEMTLRDLRTRVFIREQSVPDDLEWDQYDESALHWLIFHNEKAIGCARIVIDPDNTQNNEWSGSAKLGRVAILPGFRRQGSGTRLLREIIEQAPNLMLEQGYYCQQFEADVQCSAANFYLINGWYFLKNPICVSSETSKIPPHSQIQNIHWDANIPHISMAFSHNENDCHSNLRLGIDKTRFVWAGKDGITDISLLQLLICQGPASLFISIPDLRQPIWQHKTTLQVLSTYLRASPHREVYVLIKNEYRGLQEHPVIQLAQRISRLSIRQNNDICTNQLLAWPHGYINWDTHSGAACFNNLRECEHRKQAFDQFWENSSALKEGRRIHL